MSGSDLAVSAESADAWGAPLRVPGLSGHRNVASGPEQWPEGRQRPSFGLCAAP
ncbi:MAG: alpha/beta hydrolase [Nakamurella sp.]